MVFRDRWGYKGTETSINGLTLWLEKNLDLKGNAQTRFNETCRIIVEYGIAKFPDFEKRGHLVNAADYVAKKIDKEQLYNDFTNWVNQTKKQTKDGTANG